MTVPGGAPPGTVLAVPIRGGEDVLKVRVPDGCGAGSTLLLTKADGANQWALSVGMIVPVEDAEAEEEVSENVGNYTGVNGVDGADEEDMRSEEQRQKELEKEWLQQQQQAPQVGAQSPEKKAAERSKEPAPEEAIEQPVEPPSSAFTVRLETTVGTIDIVVRPDWAPNGTRRFLELAAAGDFDDRAFYRAVPTCIVQFGLPPKRDLPAIPDDPATGVPFLLGAVAFAAVGENTRRSTIFICTGDMSHCLGRESWETPIGAVAESSLDVLERIETCYGDIAEFGGKGPETRRINAEGNSYLKSHYPRLSYIRRAQPLDWTPPGGVEIIAEASPVPSRTTAQAAAREAQLRASEAGRSALMAAQAKDPEEAVRAAVTARQAAEAAQAAAEAAEAASAALLGAHGQSWRPPSPPRRSLAAPPGVASSSSNRSASLGSFRPSRSTLPFMIQRPGSTLHGLQSVRGNNSYVPNASLPSTPMWPQPVLPQVMAYVPQMASQASLPLPNAQLPTQVSAQHLPPQQTQPSQQHMPSQQLPPQQLPPQLLPPQQLPPQQLPPQQLPPQQLPPQQLPPQQLPFAQLLSQPASTPRQPGMAQMPVTHTSVGVCLSPQPKLFL